MAAKWTATEKWSEKNGGEQYLKDKFGDVKFKAYSKSMRPRPNPHKDLELMKYSFNGEFEAEMTYSEFLSMQ